VDAATPLDHDPPDTATAQVVQHPTEVHASAERDHVGQAGQPLLLTRARTHGITGEDLATLLGLPVAYIRTLTSPRIPDLILWSKAQADGVWLSVSDVLLVVEIISPGSEGMDTVTKRREYAGAGIPQYWTVDQDPAQTVTVHHLDGDHYEQRATMPLAWALNTPPAEHDLA
jgi:hypothetical protein